MELSAPFRLQRYGDNKFYFYLRQENGDRVYLQTRRFYSSGPFKSANGKSSMHLSFGQEVMTVLRQIHSFCKKRVACPEGIDWKLDNAWEELNDSMFVNLASDFHAFDREKKPITTLGKGFYTLLLHLPGVYLDDRPMARLQVKVVQAIFEPDDETSVCRINI